MPNNLWEWNESFKYTRLSKKRPASLQQTFALRGLYFVRSTSGIQRVPSLGVSSSSRRRLLLSPSVKIVSLLYKFLTCWVNMEIYEIKFKRVPKKFLNDTLIRLFTHIATLLTCFGLYLPVLPDEWNIIFTLWKVESWMGILERAGNEYLCTKPERFWLLQQRLV